MAKRSDKCILGRQLEELTGEHKARLTWLLETSVQDSGLSIARITVELKRAGFRASAGGVSNHRLKVCNCALGIDE